MNFDNTDFRLLANVAEAASLTRGAEKSFLSLPAASHRLKNLEDVLSIKLLHRSSQGVSWTSAGEVYLKHARIVLAELELLASDLQELGAGVKGQLRILANTTAVTEYLPEILGEYLRSHQNVNLDLRERVSDDIVRAVREGTADIGVISGTVNTDRLQTLPMTTSRVVVIAPRGHELAKQSDVRFEDLLDYEFVSLLEGSAIHSFLLHTTALIHQAMRIRVQVASYDAVCRMVLSGAGIALVPEVVLDRLGLRDQVAVLELLDLWSRREFQVCARDFTALPKFTQDFVKALIERFRP